MKPFMDKDFLLDTEAAKVLYHEYAEKMPIIDYHCHIDPMEIAEDVRWDNITQVWLGGQNPFRRLLWGSLQVASYALCRSTGKVHNRRCRSGR